jgi:uncharacterized protein
MKMKILVLAILVVTSMTVYAQGNQPDFKDPINVLVFSKTSGFRHGSISSGVKMLYDLSRQQNWVMTTTENASLLTDEFLSKMDVAVFLNPTGNAIDDAGQLAFEKFIKSGKGFVGIHSSADFEYDWPFYGTLNGGYFKTHPQAQEATVIIENTDHPAMIPFKDKKTYTTFDEWYSFKENPRPNVHVLAKLDETSIKKSNNDNWKMGDHPIIWWQEKNGARSFYTGFGHTDESFQDKIIIEHIKNAINWAAKRIN